QILRRLSGRIHEVCSAVLIYHQTSGRSTVLHDISRVRFRRLNAATIKNYLVKVDPLDKAGAYAAQGSGAEIIAKIEGSFTNVVGLPMEKTIAALAKFDIRPKISDRNDATTRAHTWQQRAVADSGRAENDVLAIRQIVRRIDAVEIFFVAVGDQLFPLLLVARPHFALHIAAETFDPGSR